MLFLSPNLTTLSKLQVSFSDSPAKVVYWVLTCWNINSIESVHGSVDDYQDV